MPLKKKKLPVQKSTPTLQDDSTKESGFLTRASPHPFTPFRQARIRRGWTALALSALGLALVGWLLIFTLGKISNFQMDFRGWIPAIAQSAGVKIGKTNILVAGVGGHSNDAPWLTDSIMLMSVDPTTGIASFLSIPRDLYVVTKDFGGTKINELYAKGRARWGEARGAQILIDKVAEITGEPIDKYVIADFDGFAQLIDLLGGIDVDVPESLTDTQYPDGNWGYETFSIDAGPQKLDGTTALKYVRSRHSTSDFDRSRRQQIVLNAIKTKLVSRDILTSPAKLRAILSTLSSHVWTDLALADMVGLGASVASRKDFQVVGANLNDNCWQNGPCSAGALLYLPPRETFGGISVLLPTESDGSDPSQYGHIRKFSYIVFHLPTTLIEAKKIRVFNATKTSGLARRFATMLRRNGLNVPEDSTGSWTGSTVTKTTLRYRPELAGSQTLEALGMWLLGPQEPFGTGTQAPQNPHDDFEVLLGADAQTFLE